MTGTWTGQPPSGRRLLVVAPHPDDETLAAGGLLRWWTARRRPALIVAVTDGEASHARSAAISADELRRRRREERAAALRLLCDHEQAVVRLRYRDQGCDRAGAELRADLHDLLTADDVVVGPAIEDRHPDHVAVAVALRDVSTSVGATLWEAPTWALVHGDAPAPDAVLTLDADTWARKQRAVAAFQTQLVALGPDQRDGPVVHPHELDLMLRPREQFRRVAS